MDLAKFIDAQKSLDATVARIDPELVGAPDISKSLFELAMFASELEKLPARFAELMAEKAKIDERRTRREAEARKTKHAVVMIETRLRKLNESLEYNISNLAAAPEADPSGMAAEVGSKLPATRRERIGQLKSEIAAIEPMLVEPKALHKKAVALYKSDLTRSKNLGREIADVGLKTRQHNDRLTEMAKLSRKTADHLKNRQACHDRKAAKRRTEPTGAEAST